MHKLFPYQHEGVEFLSSKKYALLGDEMGLGKTPQAIRGLDSIRARVAIVICPSVARINWLREFEYWAKVKRNYAVMEKLSDIPPPDHTIICSYDYATRNYKKLSKIKWDVLICDESHFIKSTDAKRAKAIMGIEGLIRFSDRCWLVSGTPAPNHPGELWIMFYTFGVTKLSYDDYLKRYCQTRRTPHGLQVLGAKVEMIPELRQLLKKIMLRRLKKDVMTQLPPITFSHKNVLPGKVVIEDQASFIQYFVPTDRREELKNEIDSQAKLFTDIFNAPKMDEDNKLRSLQGVYESVSTLRRFIGLQKVEPTIELVKNAFVNKCYDKLVIFAIHRDVIEGLRVGLREFKPVVLYGGTDPKKRQRNIDRFQNNPKCKVFIGNIHAAGTAITLTAAHNIYFVEQDWVPGNNAQALMRCHRIGQENPVSVRYIFIDNSIDNQIGYILKRKTVHLTQIFD